MKIGVMGAGAIGCYVGGRLLAAGHDVVMVGRAALAAELLEHGLHLTDYRGADVRVAKERVHMATDAAVLADRDVVLVTVKGGDTAATAQALAAVLPSGAVVVSLQNGVGNPAVLRAALLPERLVLAAMVPFNVVRKGAGAFHQGTSGALAVQDASTLRPLASPLACGRARSLVAAFVAAGMPARSRTDIVRVQWGKLVVNLNNAVNALAGIPIREMLLDAGYRQVMAAMIKEALAVLVKNGIAPRLDPPVPPRLVPWMLELSTPVFRVAARSMIRVDPQARSSMWDDLQRGRKTEIDALNGEIVKLGHAPINAAIVALIKDAEARAASAGPSQMSAAELAKAVFGATQLP